MADMESVRFYCHVKGQHTDASCTISVIHTILTNSAFLRAQFETTIT